MKKSLQSTFALIIVLATLIAWYLVYEKKVKPDQAKADEQAKQLLSLKQDDIQYIALDRHEPGNQSSQSVPTPVIKLKRTGTEWGILEPVVDGADNANITSMLGTLTTTKYERIVEEKAKDLAIYGLKDPSIKFTASKDATSPGETLFIGDDTPVGASIYVKTDKSDAVYKMPTSFKSAINKKLFDLRNKKVVNLTRPEVSEIEVQNGKDSFVLTKNEKDEWTLARENLPADAGEVNKLLGTIIDLKAKSFASEDATNLSAFGLNPPKVKIWLTKGKEKTRESVWIGTGKDLVYAKREDRKVVYEVDKDALAKITKPSTAYRSLELAKFNRFDVNRIRLERGHELLDLVKEDAGWTMPAEPKFKVDSTKMDSLLAQLQDTKAQKYLTKGEANLVKSPALVVHIFDKNNKDKAKVTLTFGKKQKDLVPVLREGLDLPFVIKDSDFARIDVTKHLLEKGPDAPPKPNGNSVPGGPGNLFENGKGNTDSNSSQEKS